MESGSDLMDVEPTESDAGEVREREHLHVLDSFPERFIPNEFEIETRPELVKAGRVYLQLPRNAPVSRAARFQWLLDHLNCVITVPSNITLSNQSNDLEIISIIPVGQNDLGVATQFLVTASTQVIFLSQVYRFVYCLDMSPSHSAVDVDRGQVLFDEIINCFRISLLGLCRQFTIPGCPLEFQPCLYLTVIVNTPFFISPAQQVIIKGVQVSSHNVQDIINSVQTQFHLLEGRIAEVSARAYDEIEQQMVDSEGMVGGLFDLAENECIAKIAMVSPDSNFVNMLRYSMLATSLLPENSLSHILVITDGVVAVPHSNIIDSLLYQLHYEGIAVSFLKVGSSFKPHTSFGYVSYDDLLEFLSHSTLGTVLDYFPIVKPEPTLEMNLYQQLYLLWSFHGDFKTNLCPKKELIDCNSNFISRVPTLLEKRQSEQKVNSTLLLLVARRMREGYVVTEIKSLNKMLRIKLTLHWKSYIYFHYELMSSWPIPKNVTHIEINISAPYDFLHDITCVMKKDTKSIYRQAVFERFWIRSTQLTASDTILAQQLSAFQSSNAWHTYPDSVRNGMPVFTANSSAPYDMSPNLVLSPSDPGSKFTQMWQPLCYIDTNNWRKWFHVHKISLILKHDPQSLSSSSGRFQAIHCRQASTALYNLLSKWSSFVLIDNHTYLRLLYRDTSSPPVWFSLIRITSKLPCVTITLGFVSGTPGYIRYQVCEELRTDLASLAYLSTPMKSKENIGCVLLLKPLEKILIRYERMPTDFHMVIFPDGTQNSLQSLPPSPLAGTLFTTLSRYLFHQRWVWSAQHLPHLKLNMQSISRILSTLTKMRIKEGFNFAHSAAGITTMVLELIMDCNSSCVLQYVIFPPHSVWCDDYKSNSGSEEDYDSKSDSEFQIVTEVWIEPQFGKVLPVNPKIAYMDGKHYYELADMIKLMDMRCIHSLLTIEHLSLISQEKYNADHADVPITTNKRSLRRRYNSSSKSCAIPPMNADINTTHWNPTLVQRIQYIPFNFDPINILPLCQQTELLFSMFIEEKQIEGSFPNGSSHHTTANRLLLDNIQKHLHWINDHELTLTQIESERFRRQICHRHRNKDPHVCPLKELPEELTLPGDGLQDYSYMKKSKWRCFVKGVSMTHVILTFVPATLEDLKEMLTDEASGYHTVPTGTISEMPERVNSQNSNLSEVPINVKHVITLPVYVYDCPVGILVDSYINTAELKIKDVYEDHRYKHGHYFLPDSIRLKSEESSASPEPKGDESEVTEPRNNAKQHCKAIVLTHSKCFAMSLFSALHYNAFIDAMDVHAAMDQCEENPFEIDITDYVETVCGHVKSLKIRDNIAMQSLHQAMPCNELRPIHRLIKDKFLKITNDAFHAIPADKEFYYCRNLYDNHSRKNEDSDDEMPLRAEFTVDSEDEDEIGEEIDLDEKLDDPGEQIKDLSPLFLHFVCTVRYNNQVHNISIRYLPTCLGELLENIELTPAIPELSGHIDFTKMQISLDILCLTLPNDVQNVISDYSSKGFRTTSFCSDGFLPSCSSASEASFASSDFKEPEPLFYIPEVQKLAVHRLKEEIKWFLQDEIATALLDIEPVSKDTLNFVIKHVTDSASRDSCIMEVIDLNFVYGTNQSYEKFVGEFSQISIPSYKLSKEEDLYFLIKTVEEEDEHTNELWEKYKSSLMPSLSDMDVEVDGLEGLEGLDLMDRSEISSMNSIHLAGYEEDVSDVEEDYNWLIDLQNKRPNLPNFWLITSVEQDVVRVYFHCRFLELNTTHVGIYYSVQRAVLFEIRNLCKRVNQGLLLQSLHDTRSCNHLLEPDEVVSDWNENNNRVVLQRLKSMEEMNDEAEVVPPNTETLLPFKVGYFSCPVVWELPFVLHPRLKTGTGKSSGLSIGISALKNVLEKFSVTNRTNMFVYKDSNANVFYLRLHENVQSIFIKGLPPKSNEFEQTVSRSPSIASLPIGQQRNVLTRSDFSISSTTSSEIRPRVRSFGEKDTKDGYSEEAVTLKVYGITQVGEDIRRDLMQVLQNRLDDAVLELLSVMLARNAMCPLTPEDVHFLQKPFKQPEDIIRLSIQDYSLKFLDSFILYLKQNLLQFLNIPKYTDPNNFRFKDYTENENNKILDDNIFIYNQSQNPASGSRGIACIALAIIEESSNGNLDKISINLPKLLETKDYINIVASKCVEVGEKPPSVYLEFRIWKQGRVNFDILRDRLCAATSHATWDIITEDSFREHGLCAPISPDLKVGRFLIDPNRERNTLSPKEHRIDLCFDSALEGADINEIMRRNEGKFEILAGRRRMKRSIPPNSTTQRAILFDNNLVHVPTRARSVEVDAYEAGDDGHLVPVFDEMIKLWFEFAMEIKAPAMRSIILKLQNSHPLYGTISELQNIIGSYSNDSVKCFIHDISRNVYVPYKPACAIQRAIIIGRNLEHWKMHLLSKDGSEYPELQVSSLKHSQKFLPGHVNGSFITRQKLLWGVIESDSIVLYTYNWSKDMVMKMRTQCGNLENWLNIRATVLSASCAQKLGLFHNQAMDRAGFILNNPYIHCIGDVEAILKFPKDRNKRTPNDTIPLEIFRDQYRPVKDDHFDPIVAATVEMFEIRKQDKKHRDELKKMYSMYQSRSNTSTPAQIQLLLQNSRVVHYCHTPLLYLPRLRLLAAATRDHSIMNPANYTLPDAQGEKWHDVLFAAFISEYKMYLQTLGFMALEVEAPLKKHSSTRKHPEVRKDVYYMQKAIMGGILLFTMELCEPFFITKLNSVECNRIATSNSRAAINQFTQSFLDESDKIKVYTHLHSFTYDFHLRSVYNYIARTNGYKVCEGYHLTHFLDDFMKYYNKAPNYARNLVHADTIVVPNLRTEGKQLYNYLLSNVKQYKFNVVNMADELTNATEYVLVQVSNISGVSYKDSQDRQHTDDFDITLIISRISPGDPNEYNLHLKYYLILTTRREIYPKIDVERKLGKFRTVSCSRNIEDRSRDDDSISELGSLASLEIKSDSEKSQILPNYQSTDEECVEDKRSRLKRKPSYVQIKQESVNYLGYYSSHEQLMQQLILNCAENTQKTIRDMVKQGMVHCRTHLLWNKLLMQQDGRQLTYSEFVELKSLARLENLCDIHPNLGTLVRQPFAWYQGLAKMLLSKYQDQHRTYISDDGNVQHYVILHPRYVGAFMMLSIDLHMSRGDLYAVYRTASKYDDSDVCVTDRKTLIDGFINCICFYLWSGMI